MTNSRLLNGKQNPNKMDRFIILQWIDQQAGTWQVVNWNYQLQDPSQPVTGLDPDLEVMVWRVVNNELEIDPLLYILKESHEPTQTPDETYPHFNKFLSTYRPIKRPDEEIIENIENIESESNETLVKINRKLKKMWLGICINDRRAKGLNINAKMEEHMDDMQTTGTKLWKNDANAQLLKDKLAQGELPDITDGWEKDGV